MTKTPTALRLWRLGLTEGDYQALDYLRERLDVPSATQVVRMACTEVSRINAGNVTDAWVAHLWRLTRTAKDYKSRGRWDADPRDQLRNTTFRFSKADFAHARAVQENWDFESRTDAVRFAIRAFAEKRGFRPTAGW